ncbi:DMT family transporter [Rhodovarius crocodyli]|uniref:DMT family transporter n=2 Tax=Rhodovarius crocodyli TaxID=1979269 RepID=A0A437MPY1_9PROT|nr:DMT family transporter [Rhodovarius crocodyli]
MALVGANVGVAKLLSEALPIALIAHLRCVLAFVVLFPLARSIEGFPRPSRAVLGNLFWQAVFGTAIYNAGLLAGLRLTSALEGGMVLATLPAVVAMGSFLWLREKLSARQWVAAGLAGLGMAAITLARLGDAGGVGSLLGNALIFVGVVGEAVYVLLAKRVAGQAGVYTASFWMQLFSAAVLLPFAAPDYGAVAKLADPGLGGLLVFHSLTASVACLVLWYRGLRRVPAGVAGVFTALLPASAAVTAVAVLGERFSAVHVVGFALMGVSVVLATWPKRG